MYAKDRRQEATSRKSWPGAWMFLSCWRRHFLRGMGRNNISQRLLDQCFIKSMVTQRGKTPQRIKRSLGLFVQTLENLHTSCCLKKGRKHLKGPLKTETLLELLLLGRRYHTRKTRANRYLKRQFLHPSMKQLMWMYVGLCVHVIASNAIFFLFFITLC